MKLALLGVGNAGVRLVDQLHGAEGPTMPISNGNVLVINTTPSTFAEIEHLSDDRCVLIGDTHPEVYQPRDAEADGDAADRREGVAGDPELGAAVAREDLPEIRRALDSVDDTEVDGAMIACGLGGGTGSGVGSVLLEELTSIYEIPVYVLGVLPGADESNRRAWTAARGIRTLVPMADAVLPVDNEAWHDPADETYSTVNEVVADRFLSLFDVGTTEEPLPEVRMDPNDIRRTLAVGGVSTVGHVRTELDIGPDGWFSRLRRLLGVGSTTQPAQNDATTIKTLVAEAIESEFTLPCDISTADRVLLVLSGPPAELSRKGFEAGRALLESETGTVEILAGDNPNPDASAVTATLLLSNVTGVPRIESLQQRAVAYQTEQTLQSALEEMDQPDVEAAATDGQSTEHSNDQSTASADDADETKDTGDTDDADETEDTGDTDDADETENTGDTDDADEVEDADEVDDTAHKADEKNKQPDETTNEAGFQFEGEKPADDETRAENVEPATDDSDKTTIVSIDGEATIRSVDDGETTTSDDEKTTASVDAGKPAVSVDDEAAVVSIDDDEAVVSLDDETEAESAEADDPDTKDPFADESTDER